MTELKIDYEKLEDMPLEEAKEIISRLDYEHFLEEVSGEVNGKRYGFHIVEEGNWDDEGKYQFRNDIGILCEYDEDWTAIKMFNIAATSAMTRCGSYFSEYYYEYDKLTVNKVIKKIIPKQIIPEREVITLDE